MCRPDDGSEASYVFKRPIFSIFYHADTGNRAGRLREPTASAGILNHRLRRLGPTCDRVSEMQTLRQRPQPMHLSPQLRYRQGSLCRTQGQEADIGAMRDKRKRMNALIAAWQRLREQGRQQPLRRIHGSLQSRTAGRRSAAARRLCGLRGSESYQPPFLPLQVLKLIRHADHFSQSSGAGLAGYGSTAWKALH